MSTVSKSQHNLINKRGEVNAYWWNDKPNFGDAIGPYLINKMTGKSVANVRRDRSQPALFSVGSIITMMDRKDCTVWGSGLINSLDQSQIERLTRAAPKVLAVRGHLTRNNLEESLGWSVPKIFGDPALLLPEYLTPSKVGKKIALCPHFSHRSSFKSLKSHSDIDLIDVADPMEDVVSRIATAELCLSTSLHGIIVAQAYGVPWVWLYFKDHHLSGSDFKFKDFFSTLEAFDNGIFGLDKETEINADMLLAIAQHTTLPNLKIDLQKLKDSFPLV